MGLKNIQEKLENVFFFLFFNFPISGLTETAAHLQGAANGQGLPQKSLPNVHQLAKKAMNGYNFELGLLSPPGSAAAEFVTTSSGMNYTSVMATLAKGQLISECLLDFLNFTKKTKKNMMLQNLKSGQIIK